MGAVTFPDPTGSSLDKTTQEMVDLLCRNRVLPFLPTRSVFTDKQLSDYPASILDARLPLVQYYEVFIGSFLQSVSTLDCIDHLYQFGVIHKLTESTLCPHMQVVKEDMKKKYWSQQ